MPKLTNLILNKRGKSEELSRNTGVSSGSLSNWKSGRSKPGLEFLLKLQITLIAHWITCWIGRMRKQ